MISLYSLVIIIVSLYDNILILSITSDPFNERSEVTFPDGMLLLVGVLEFPVPKYFFDMAEI